MGLKKISILLLALALIILAVPTGDVSGIEPMGAIILDLSLSRPPRLGETAELVFTTVVSEMMDYDEPSFTHSRAWVEFSYVNTKGSYSETKLTIPIPPEEVLVSGELYWEGNAVENRVIKLLSTVQLPREGLWKITGYFSVEGWERPLETSGRVGVTENVAQFMDSNLTDKTYKNILAVVFNLLTGRSLHYLDYSSYGGKGGMVPTENRPTVLELDIPKIPKAGEEVTVSCRIDSLVDAPDYSAEIEFGRRLGDGSIVEIPADSLLVDGNLSWRGDLKKNEPVEFSATVIFPENGDWRIQVRGKNPKHTGLILTDTIKLHIHGNKGYYGWGEQLIKWDFSCKPKPERDVPAIPPIPPPTSIPPPISE